MKKYIALILATFVLLSAFAACSTEIKGGEEVTDAAGETFAALTESNGGLARDEAGNLLLAVTDENGKAVTGENGETLTNAVALDHALVVGNRIECNTFAITIPEGWSNHNSYNDLNIINDADQTKIVISDFINGDLLTKAKERTTVIDLAIDQFGDAAKTLRLDDVEICGTKGFYDAVYNQNNGTSIAYYHFQKGTVVYSVFVTGERDLSEIDKEIEKILNTLEFVGNY